MKISLLDCTLRDGGYINNWEFGKTVIEHMIEKLTETNVEIFEIGFLKNESYDDNRVVFNSMQQVKNVIGKKKPGIFYTVMCEVVNPLPLEMLEPADNESADAIRVVVWKTKHKDGKIVDALDEGYEYCKGIVEKGYKLCVQPARVDQYSDEEFINMVKKFSALDPMAIYVVDSWGTQNAEELLRYMHLADDNMPKNIKLGYHGHNNMMQALPVAQAMIKENFERDIMIDASIYGIGRGAGNLNLEIIAKYMNEHYGKEYDVIPMLEVYEKHIKYIYEKEKWGYSVQYYLTAKHNCNPNYVKYIEKYDISNVEFNEILANLLGIDKVIVNDNKVKDILYSLRKKKLCIIVPTYNRTNVIKVWIEEFAEIFFAYGIDLVIYDSSDNKDIYNLVNEANKCNVIYDEFCGEWKYKYQLDEKVYAAYKKYSYIYDYVWVCRDRSIPIIKNIYSAFEEMVENRKDALYVYPHGLPGYAKYDFNSDLSIIMQYGEMISLGSIIYSSQLLHEMIEMCPITKYGLWTPDAMFHVIAKRDFCVGFIMNCNFYSLPYTGSSFWIKNKSSDRLWLEYWPELVNNLPDEYNKYKDALKRYIGWAIPPYKMFMLLPAHASGSYTIRYVLKNIRSLYNSGKKNMLKVLMVSLLPSFVSRYIVNNSNSLTVRMLKYIFKIIYICFNKLNIFCEIIKFIFPNKVEYKLSKDLGERKNNIQKNNHIKSIKVYGKNDIVEPKITIVIPTYKRHKKLRDAICSLKEQKKVTFEWDIVIVDNDPYVENFSNATQKLIETLDWNKITYYRNVNNLGAAGNFNRGMELAKGKWVAILHDDDLLNQDYLEKIERRINAAENHSSKTVAMLTDVHTVCSSVIDSSDKKKWKDFLYGDKMRSNSDDDIIYPISKYEYIFTGGCGVGAPTAGTIYKRDIYLETGGMDESVSLVDDSLFAYSLIRKYGVYRSNYPMGYYRQGNNATSNKAEVIIKDLFAAREYVYSLSLIGKLFGHYFREEFLGRDVQYISEMTSNSISMYNLTDLIKYRPNRIRSWFATMVAKLYRLFESIRAIKCEDYINGQEGSCHANKGI